MQQLSEPLETDQTILSPRSHSLAIKAFSVDLNWDLFGRACSPGLHAKADPAAQVDWYAELGANVIQTFCVTYNGYAAFESDVAPVTPGLRSDFLSGQVEGGHSLGMKVMGYFCLGSNPFYALQRPTTEWHDLTKGEYQNIQNHHLPFSERYLDYFCASVRDALIKTDIDGFMVDWFRVLRGSSWLEIEKEMWWQLMGEEFPRLSTPPPEEIVEFDRRQIARAWTRLRDTVLDTRKAIIWTNHPFSKADDPVWNNHPLLKEVDWVLNEAPDTGMLDWLESQCGPQTTIVQNLCGWAGHDAASWKEIDYERFGLYGFAAANPATSLPWTEKELASARRAIIDEKYFQIPIANARNIQRIREAFAS